MYRMIFRDGMRYDFGFEFEYADHLKLDLGKQPDADEENDTGAWKTVPEGLPDQQSSGKYELQ